MGSEGSGGARVSDNAKGCDTGRSLVFAGVKTERSSPRGAEYNSNPSESSPCIKKADTGSCRNTVQLSTIPKEGLPRELYGASTSNSLVLAAGHGYEGKKLQRKERRVSKTSPGCFKIPRAPQLETSISAAENVDMKDSCDDLGSHMLKSSYADVVEKSQTLKQKYNLNGKRGDRRNSKAPLKTKYDGFAGFSPALGGNKVFGTYGLKPDVHDITKLVDDISLDKLLDGSYKCPNVGKEKEKRPANTSENILHSIRKSVSLLQHRGLSHVNKQCDEIDVAFSKELSSIPTSNLSTSSNLDDEESSLASDLSCTKVQESCVNNEVPSDPLVYHPRDIIEKLALPPPKDLDSLLQDAAKLTLSRYSDPRKGKPMSGRVTLSSFSWSHNHNGHSKSNSDSVKVSSRSSCHGRWARIGNTASFSGGDLQSFADLESLTFDHNLVPSGSVKYILPQSGHAVSNVSNSIISEHASSSFICSTSSQPPPALQSPRAMAAAQALFDIANTISNPTANGIIKWPKQPSQKAMKARKLKSIQSSENLLAPKSEMAHHNTVRFMDHTASPLKKPKLLISEKRDHSGHVNATPKAPHFPSAPRSSRSSPTRASRDSGPDANRHHVNGSFSKPLFKPPPRRVTEKTNHSHQKLRKVLQMDWNRGKG